VGRREFSGCKAQERVEGIITTANGLVAWHLTIRLDTMLKAEELPASIADLDTTLTSDETRSRLTCQRRFIDVT